MSRNMSRSQHMTMRNGRFNTTRSGAGFDSRGGQGLLDIDAVLFNQRRRDFHYGIDNSDIDIDNLQHQLQQQLSLRESQLALANSLLQRQSHMLEEMSMGAHGDMLVGGRMSDFGMYGEMVNKRRPETRLGFFDFQPENKRFRQDIHSLVSKITHHIHQYSNPFVIVLKIKVWFFCLFCFLIVSCMPWIFLIERRQP